jgi:C1A family cysteine protease
MKLTATILASLLLAGTASAKLGRSWDIEARFDAWRSTHGFSNVWKTEGEYERRLAIFADNVARIEAHNAQGESWDMEINEFAHLTAQEFTEQRTGARFGLPKVPVTIPREQHQRKLESNPSSVDWTTEGAVTGVKNQGSCGSCWSFSTTGSLEGAYFLKNNDLVSFSEQNLVSCDTGDNGCNGGLMDNAFRFIESNLGLCTEADYPYTSGAGSTGTCQSSCTVQEGSVITKFTDVSPSPQVTPATVEDMESAVAGQPVSVAIEADQMAFQFYKNGVMTGSCGTALDHGVLVVGYGTDSGTDYWKIKNSWGASWGEDGYIRIQKGNSQKGGQCGVLLAPSYPSV